MFIGHFAVGFASKRLSPRTPLSALILAPLFLDLLWPLFLAAGIETVRIDPGNTAVTPLDLHDYPYSHSLVTAIGWSVLVAAIWLAWKKDRAASGVLAAGVFSHWVLDWVTHRPDMPLYPGSATYVGLGLWGSKVATVAVELPMFIGGVILYAIATRAKDLRGKIAFAALVAFLLLIYAANLLGPPPPSVSPVIGAGLAMWLFVPWAGFIDRHRGTS